MILPQKVSHLAFPFFFIEALQQQASLWIHHLLNCMQGRPFSILARYLYIIISFDSKFNKRSLSYSNWFPRPRWNKCYVRLCSILKQGALNALPSSIVFRCSFVCTSVRKLSQLRLTIFFCVWFGASGDIFLLHSKVFSVFDWAFLLTLKLKRV